MKTVGIVAEFNPFHNGHAYQIARAKEMTGADYCVVVMSGSFVQRGIPAIMSKEARTQAALASGADLVIELPAYYATASAEYFASGAIAILDKLGVIDDLCFGSECGDIEALSTLADAFVTETDDFKLHLRQELHEGHSFPQARNSALSAAAPELTPYMDILRFPNNILGVEYIKAIKTRRSTIVPHTIQRAGSDYHDTRLDYRYSSALAIRESIIYRGDISFVRDQIPFAAYRLMETSYQKDFPILGSDVTPFLPYKLIQEQEDGYTKYLDVDEDFSDRIKKMLYTYDDYDSFCERLKCKNMTYSRVARNLLHIMLDIYQEDIETYRREDYAYYARMLGFREEASPLLNAIKNKSSIPLLSKLADAEDLIPSQTGRKLLHHDIRTNHIYSLLVQQKFGQKLQSEYTKRMIVF